MSEEEKKEQKTIQHPLEDVFNIEIINHSLYFYANKKTPGKKRKNS